MLRAIFIFSFLIILKGEAQSLPAGRQVAALTIADSLYATGNYTKAINTYAKIGSQKSGLQIARAYNAIGNYEKAILQYESTIVKIPELQIARFEQENCI